MRLEPGATQALDKTLLDAFWAGSAGVTLSVSNTPPIDIKEQVQGLLMYPYGCLEQTTSSAYPLVFIDDEAAQRWGLKPVLREERAKRLEGAFARLAGMPAPVLQHARLALQSLEQQEQSSRSQVDLFAPAPEPIEAGPTPLQAKLAQLDPDALSPREALDALYQLKKLS